MKVVTETQEKSAETSACLEANGEGPLADEVPAAPAAKSALAHVNRRARVGPSPRIPAFRPMSGSLEAK